MRIILTCVFIATLLGCEREEMEVEDTVFQHGIEYMDKAEEAEATMMEGAKHAAAPSKNKSNDSKGFITLR